MFIFLIIAIVILSIAVTGLAAMLLWTRSQFADVCDDYAELDADYNETLTLLKESLEGYSASNDGWTESEKALKRALSNIEMLTITNSPGTPYLDLDSARELYPAC